MMFNSTVHIAALCAVLLTAPTESFANDKQISAFCAQTSVNACALYQSQYRIMLGYTAGEERLATNALKPLRASISAPIETIEVTGLSSGKIVLMSLGTARIYQPNVDFVEMRTFAQRFDADSFWGDDHSKLILAISINSALIAATELTMTLLQESISTTREIIEAENNLALIEGKSNSSVNRNIEIYNYTLEYEENAALLPIYKSDQDYRYLLANQICALDPALACPPERLD